MTEANLIDWMTEHSSTDLSFTHSGTDEKTRIRIRQKTGGKFPYRYFRLTGAHLIIMSVLVHSGVLCETLRNLNIRLPENGAGKIFIHSSGTGDE